MQQRLEPTRRDVERTGVAVTHHVFDVLRLEGRDTRQLPLQVREPLPRRTLAHRTPVRLTPHRNAGGAELLADACARGWQGLIAGGADGPYAACRSTDRPEPKCSRGQEWTVVRERADE
ncbi:hypothetical protein OHB00_48440 [Streptomyces sp. NBC_00631]|uniref:hypothetical protein n=1 Tax=Streptomyces sp. NBC_00631 TaxID=2975793 RepID=UPI0030DF31EC